MKQVPLASDKPFVLGKILKKCCKSVEFNLTCIKFTPCTENTIQGSLLSNLLNIEEITSFHMGLVSLARKVPFARNKNSNVSAKAVNFNYLSG